MNPYLFEKNVLALQTEVIAIKNACGQGGANLNGRYPSKKELGLSDLEYKGRYPDDLVLSYSKNIQNFVRHTVSSGGESTCVFQNHSYRASAYQVVYNITEILNRYIKSGQDYDEFDFAQISDNLNALKRHRYNPSAAGKAHMSRTGYQWMLDNPDAISYFVINNDVGMYLLAKRLHRCLSLNSNNIIFKQKAFRELINNLDDEINKHENSSDFLLINQLFLNKYQLFSSNNEISPQEMIAFAEREFTDIYKRREEFSKHISTSKIMIFSALRLLAILSVTACVVGIFVAFSIEMASIMLAIIAAMAGLLMIMSIFNLTYLPLSISESAIQKNNENYNELQSAINKEFGPGTHTKTTETLIEEQSLNSQPQHGEQHYWISLVTPSWTFS